MSVNKKELIFNHLTKIQSETTSTESDKVSYEGEKRHAYSSVNKKELRRQRSNCGKLLYRTGNDRSQIVPNSQVVKREDERRNITVI